MYHAATVDPSHRTPIDECLLPLSQYLGGDPYSDKYTLPDLKRWGDAIMAATNESVAESKDLSGAPSMDDHRTRHDAGGWHQVPDNHAE